jgi:hypothetical protein
MLIFQVYFWFILIAISDFLSGIHFSEIVIIHLFIVD